MILEWVCGVCYIDLLICYIGKVISGYFMFSLQRGLTYFTYLTLKL